MKRISKALLTVILSSSFCNLVKADVESFSTYGIKVTGDSFNSGPTWTGSQNLTISKCSSNKFCEVDIESGYTRTGEMIQLFYEISYVDEDNNLILPTIEREDGKNIERLVKFDGRTDTFSVEEIEWSKNYDSSVYKYDKKSITKNTDGSLQIGGEKIDLDILEDGLNIDGTAVITKNADGSIQIGTDANDIDITTEGLNIDGNPLITKKDNGEIHIGKNSLITTSEEGTLSDGRKVQPLYAKDADGNKIPINIDGSKLLIDGVEVTAGVDSAQVTTNKNNISTNTLNISANTSNIKNLGEGVAGSTALTAALTALPQTSKESKLSCGVGTGAYSSRYAFGFGCASKVNERVDINAGGSYVFGGSKSYGGGTLDSGVVKAGFVFKLGELNKPTQISFKDKKLIDKKLSTLEENNINLNAELKLSKAKNDEIISQNQKLIARLEKLENIALKFQSSSEMISVAKKD